MSRIRASSIHFFISFVIGLFLLALCWYVWYPAPMLTAIGGHEIFLLIIGVDVVLGPLLTLVVYKVGKASLKWDLIVIVLLQASAMYYGVSTLLEARPVYVAALGDKFQVVQASEITDGNISKAKTSLPWWGPLWVGTKPPIDKHDISTARAIEEFGGGRGHMPQLHVPYASMSVEILRNAQTIAELKKRNLSAEKKIDEWLANKGFDEQTARFQPVKVGASKFVVILSASNASVIGIAPFNP